MQEHQTHGAHTHVHGPGCGHPGIRHGSHIDYAHDGHLHRPHDGHMDECRLEVAGRNMDSCKTGHECAGHDRKHQHGPKCGHEMIPHGDHSDYMVAGHLHHAHDGHCDDHGPVERA